MRLFESLKEVKMHIFQSNSRLSNERTSISCRNLSFLIAKIMSAPGTPTID